MGHVIIQYGTSQIAWPDCQQVNEVDSSGWVSVTTTDNEIIQLRRFDDLESANNARQWLISEISEKTTVAEGNGDVIVTIDDL